MADASATATLGARLLRERLTRTLHRTSLAGRLLRSPLPLFLVLAAFFLAVHEPWRDEAMPWLLVRDAQPGFWAELDSEGSPGLWYALLWPLAKLGLPFWSMRVLHVALAAGALAVFLLHAPFSRLERFLFAFGYFVAFEYAAIARSYVLVLLLLSVLAAFWTQRHERPLRHAFLLFLLANVTAHSALLAGVLAAAFAWETLWRRAFAPLPLLAAALPFFGVLLAFASVLPADDIAEWRTGTLKEWALNPAVETARAVMRALLPYPGSTPHELWWWGRLAWDGLSPEGMLWAGGLTYAASLLLFVRTPRVLLLWLAGSALLLAVYYTKFVVSSQTRHHGLLFVLFVFCVWISRLERPPGPIAPRRLAVVLALTAHFAALFPAIAADAQQPFAGGAGAAEWLREHDADRQGVLVASYPDFIGPPVLVHLDHHRAFYYPQVDAYGSYVRWTKAQDEGFRLPREEIVHRVEAEADRVGASRAFLLLSFHTSEPWFTDQWTLRASFDSIASGDAVHVYERVSSVGEGSSPVGTVTTVGTTTPSSGTHTNTSVAAASQR